MIRSSFPPVLLVLLLRALVWAAATSPAPAQPTPSPEPAPDSTRRATATATPIPAGAPSSQGALTAAERWRALRSEVTAPILLLGSAGPAFSDYRAGRPSSWRGGALGYGFRVGSHAGRLLLEAGVAHGLAATTGLDLRFRTHGHGPTAARLRHAALGALTARTPGGTRVPNVPRLVGTYGAALAQQRWQAGGVRPADAALTTTLALGVDVVVNVITEFTDGS